MAAVLEPPSALSTSAPDPVPAPETSPAENPSVLNVHSTLADLEAHSIARPSAATGADLGQLFAERVDLPGVILMDGSDLAGVVSRSHYYHCVSRQFGREIYLGRPAGLMLVGVHEQTLTLPEECRIENAVEACLARPLPLVYEPFLIHAADRQEYRLCSFQVLLLASTQIAALRNGQMAQILNSVTDGLLVIDRHFQIGDEYSKAAAQLFERNDLQNYTLLEILAPLVAPELHEKIADYLKILFAPKLIDKLIRSVNPAKQIAVRFSTPEDHTKYFAFNFERVRTGTEISQVLVRVEDVTAGIQHARELERQEAEAEKKLQLILQILQVQPSLLASFLQRFRLELAALRDLARGTRLDDGPEAVRASFRAVHTLKGEASLLHLPAYEKGLHRMEDALDSLRQRPVITAMDFQGLDSCCQALHELDGQMQEAMDYLQQLPARSAADAGPETAGAAHVPDPARAAQNEEPLPQPVAMARRLIEDLNTRTGKSVMFHTAVQDEELPDPYRGQLHEALLHLARNSMVHGIEDAATRQQAGKPAQGAIQFAMKLHPHYHEFIFQDDGGGLNHERIRRRAAEMGQELTTEEQLNDAIFLPGFSTSAEVTDLAGRGVGLDSVRHSIQQAGGTVRVFSQEGVYCAFQILLPLLKSGAAP